MIYLDYICNSNNIY